MEILDHPPMTWREDQRIAWPMKKLGHAQLGPAEGAMLYYLARDWVSGRHPLLELGSFLGGSASLTGAGLMANPAWDGAARLHCFDIFEARFGDMAEFIRTRIDPAFRDGADFQHLFEAQTAEVARALQIHKGDFTQARWDDGPVDLIFVDIAKTPELNRVVLERFLPALRPGPGLLVNQDFHNADNPWIHCSLGHLIGYFDLVEPRADDSILLRLRKTIPAATLREAGRWEELSLEEALARVDKLRALFRGGRHDTRYIELVRARLLLHAGDAAGALALVDEALEQFGPGDEKEHFFWLRRCRAIQEDAA
ncbi:class I SAM-dependent methyltransferase [Pseudooceanicola sp. 200-1SW]|uniref:class I SAM-dependent methyltransferase n=1 Tax=Pseudooceanicola sp. 200-1SW TaxID=3425949 RepID=UPI003D7F573E